MSLNLFAHWENAVASGILPHNNFIFVRYRNWLGARGLVPEDVDRQTYELMYTEMALDGLSPVQFANYDSGVRRFYRWAADMRLIPDVPFGDFQYGHNAKSRRAAITTDEITQLIDHAVLVALDESRRTYQRIRAARTGLSVAFAYYSGLSQAHFVNLNMGVLHDLSARKALPETFRRAVEMYRYVIGNVGEDPDNPVFMRSFSDPFADDEGANAQETALNTRLTSSPAYVSALREIAEDTGLYAPERFNYAEILRARRETRHRLNNVVVTGTVVAGVRGRTPKDWTKEDVIALAKLHPGYA